MHYVTIKDIYLAYSVDRSVSSKKTMGRAITMVMQTT